AVAVSRSLRNPRLRGLRQTPTGRQPIPGPADRRRFPFRYNRHQPSPALPSADSRRTPSSLEPAVLLRSMGRASLQQPPSACPGRPPALMTLITPDTFAWDASNSTPNPCPTPDETPAPQNDAVAFVGGSTMTASVTFSVTPVPSQDVPNVHIEGVIPNLGKLN